MKVCPTYTSKHDDDDDDDDYENTNPCDTAPVVPSRKTRKVKDAWKNDLPSKCKDRPTKQPPTVWTTSQKGFNSKETPRFPAPAIGLDFSSGAVNAAFSDTGDVKLSSVSPNITFPDLEVMSKRNKQRSGRSMVVLTALMVIIFLALVGVTGFIFLRYITVSEKVADLEQTGLDFQEKSMEKQNNLKTKVADLNNTIVKLQDLLMANIKHINKTLENTCTLCPVGWSVIGSSCYFVSEESLNWNLARDECYKMNSILVMIKDKAESDSQKKLFKSNKRYWIGLRRDPGERHIWKWLDGTQITFTNWDVNEPNNYADREHCGETISGPWNDRNCADPLFYICKRVRTCKDQLNIK